MDLTGLQAIDPAPGFSSSSGSSSSADIDRDAFMQLLVAQLTNQDPLEPVNNEDFTAQLAQFSSLEQLEEMNSSLETLMILQQGNALLSQVAESSALIGQTVAWADPEVDLEGSGKVESVELIEGITYLTIDEQKVPLAFVTEVHNTPPDSADTSEDSSDSVEESDTDADSSESDA